MKYYIMKWSDGKTGQVQGGGWKDEAYDRYTFYQQHVVDFRKRTRQIHEQFTIWGWN